MNLRGKMSLQYLIQVLREGRNRQKENPANQTPAYEWGDNLKRFDMPCDHRDKFKDLNEPCDRSQRR